MHTIGEKRIRMLKPREIKCSQIQIRTQLDERELFLLRDSVAASGVLQPLLVRKIGKGTYQLISGERRLRAALMAGLRRVPCVVHNVDERTAILYSLTENLQNSGLSFFDEARILDLLISKMKTPMTIAAAHLGVSQSTITSKLQILRLDERLSKRIMAANLSEEHAKVILNLPTEWRAQALDTIICEGLTAKQAENYAFAILNPPLKTGDEEKDKMPPPETPKEKAVRKSAIGDVRLFSNSLSKLVETLRDGGINAGFRKTENDRYIDYKIRIKKETTEIEEFAQLKICQ